MALLETCTEKKIGLYRKNGNVELLYGFITPKAIGICERL